MDQSYEDGPYGDQQGVKPGGDAEDERLDEPRGAAMLSQDRLSARRS